MMRKLLFLALCSLTFAVGCGSPAGDFCTKEAECEKADCMGKYRPEVCDDQAAGQYDGCMADAQAWQDSLDSGSHPSCQVCADATDAYYTCAASQASCSAFGTLDNCSAQVQTWGEACNGIEDSCFK